LAAAIPGPIDTGIWVTARSRGPAHRLVGGQSAPKQWSHPPQKYRFAFGMIHSAAKAALLKGQKLKRGPGAGAAKVHLDSRTRGFGHRAETTTKVLPSATHKETWSCVKVFRVAGACHSSATLPASDSAMGRTDSKRPSR
jgi:hypothetical protein